MLISFVVRLAPAALSTGVLAGEVEHVSSGDRGQFRDAAELTSWCARTAVAPSPEADAPGPQRTASSAPLSSPSSGHS